MARIFGHGGLRLVLLSLLEDGPKHGYELIIALEERFMGMYRPSSGTVYPRLAALEEEGLITGTESGGKRIYALTDAGREELARRRSELDETVITATSTVRNAMEEIQAEIRSTVAAVQAEVGEAAAEARRQAAAVVEEVRSPESAARQAWIAGEHARRLAVDEAKRVRRAADDLRRQAEVDARQAARRAQEAARADLRRTAIDVGDELRRAAEDVRRQSAGMASGARAELDDLLGEVAGWASEVADAVRRRLPTPEQRDRLRGAVAAGREAFAQTLVDHPADAGTAASPDDATDQPSEGGTE